MNWAAGTTATLEYHKAMAEDDIALSNIIQEEIRQAEVQLACWKRICPDCCRSRWRAGFKCPAGKDLRLYREKNHPGVPHPGRQKFLHVEAALADSLIASTGMHGYGKLLPAGALAWL
jgi:hypothetical protein